MSIQSQHLAAIARNKGGGGSFTLQDVYPNEDTGANLAVGNGATRQYCAIYMDIGRQGGTAPYTCTKIGMYLKKTGTPTFNLLFRARTNVTNSPLVSLGVTSSFNVATLTTSYQWIELTLNTGLLTLDTIIWGCAECDAVGDVSNCVNWAGSTDIPFDNFSRTYCKASSDSVTWNNVENAMKLMRFYS